VCHHHKTSVWHAGSAPIADAAPVAQLAVAQASPLASARQLQALAAGRLLHTHETVTAMFCQCRLQVLSASSSGICLCRLRINCDSQSEVRPLVMPLGGCAALSISLCENVHACP